MEMEAWGQGFFSFQTPGFCLTFVLLEKGFVTVEAQR